MAELQHPAVVPVLERHGEDGGYHYFVMEYVAGGNLREAVLEKALTREQFLSVILRIGEALALAHTRGLIHRDVKPANILLPVPERPLLTDFDLVGAADTTGGTRTGAMGTIIYAAPECLDRPQEADPRADIYSLGMTTIFGLHGADLPLHMLRNPETRGLRALVLAGAEGGALQSHQPESGRSVPVRRRVPRGTAAGKPHPVAVR